MVEGKVNDHDNNGNDCMTVSASDRNMASGTQCKRPASILPKSSGSQRTQKAAKPFVCSTADSAVGAGTAAQANVIQNRYLPTEDRSDRARTPYKDCENPHLDKVRVAERIKSGPLASNAMSPAALVNAESYVIQEGYQRLSTILNLGHHHLAELVAKDFLHWALIKLATILADKSRPLS